jgi:hypothetical protein
MTDLWKFSETPLSGGTSLEEASLEEASLEETSMKGGMSVADFFCQKRPEGDSQRFTLFTDLTVPLGLVYLPCDDSSDDSMEDEPNSSSDVFDRLFSLCAITLGKKEANRRTRKKIAV